MASRTLGLVVGGLGIAAGVALALLAPSPPAKPRLDAASVAADLDGRLREAAAGLHQRASTLAEVPRLAAAVSTDANTVRDMASEELAFRPQPNETITIGQVPKTPGGKPTALLTLPTGAAEPPMFDRPGARLDLRGGKLVIVEVVAVTPRERADEVTGMLAVSWLADLSSVAQKLDAVGASARLQFAGGKIAIGQQAMGEVNATPPLSSELAKGAQLEMSVPTESAGSPPLRPFGFGLAALGVILGLVLSRPRKPEPMPLAVGSPARTNVATPEARASTSMSLDASTEGLQIGRYTVVRRLGSGGMAEVFLARSMGEAGFEKLVALKVLNKAYAAQAVAVEHFLDEARLASRLTHPNIVQISDLGKAGDEYFIAMEYVEGADLERLLEGCRQRGEQVPVRVALHILRKICDGLHAAHTAAGADGQPLELVHRDVKSANMFIAKNGVVKIGDFGIAKANVPTRQKTEIGMVKGTAEYMAPEHRVGQPIDRRADIYAVGAIAYEMLTGTIVNLDLALLADKGKVGWPHQPKPSAIRAELPPALDEIVFRALAYDKESRFSTAAELEEAFEKVATQSNNAASDKIVAQWVEASLAAEAASAALTAAG